MSLSRKQTPDAAISELAGALLELHRSLIDIARADYERERGSVGSPVDLLHLLMHDPFFQWLRPLSEFVAELDALFGMDDARSRDKPMPEAAAVRAEVEHFLDAQGNDFVSSYSGYLDEPRLAIAHGRVRLALSALPVPPERRH